MPSLTDIVKALLNTEAYPEKPTQISLVQTQMSFVFIAGDFVYKIKKPVDLGFLDYTTLEKRHYLCQKEVELNRRLCPETYLGVVPITSINNTITVDGEGEIIEYAVKMKRLPQDLMMNILLEKNLINPKMISRLATKLSEFHARAGTSHEIRHFGTPEAIKFNTDENFSQTEKYISLTLSPRQFEAIKNYTDRFFTENRNIFEKRIFDDKIRDCHGDLHAAHVCFTNGICIYDCIEFNDRFRYCDVTSEIAFLAMDLDHYGRADLSRLFVEQYIQQSKDLELINLLNFYKCYRAYVRGKVESFKLDDPFIPEEDKVRIKSVASGYFDLAESYTWMKPLLLITTGLVGSGKSTISGELARRIGLVILSSDIIRKQIAGITPTERRFENFNDGIYSAEFTRLTYDTLFREAGKFLSRGISVILDASFISKQERLKAENLARECGANYFIVECRLREEIIKERLASRLKLGGVSDGRWEIYLPQKTRFEPVDEVDNQQHIIVDTSFPVDQYIDEVVEKIARSI